MNRHTGGLVSDLGAVQREAWNQIAFEWETSQCMTQRLGFCCALRSLADAFAIKWEEPLPSATGGWLFNLFSRALLGSRFSGLYIHVFSQDDGPKCSIFPEPRSQNAPCLLCRTSPGRVGSRGFIFWTMVARRVPPYVACFRIVRPADMGENF